MMGEGKNNKNNKEGVGQITRLFDKASRIHIILYLPTVIHTTKINIIHRHNTHTK